MFEKLDGDFVVLDDTILFYKGSATKVVVPSSIDGNPIRRIGDGAFCENANIKSIEISEGIEEIGLFSMAMMPKLSYLKLPDTIKKLDNTVVKQDYRLPQIDVEWNISDDEYKKLMDNSFYDSEGFRVIGLDYRDIKMMEMFGEYGLFLQTFVYVRPIHRVEKEVKRLFVELRSPDGVKDDFPIVTSFDMCGGDSGISYEEDILDKIAGIKDGTYVNPENAASEEAKGKYIKEGRKPDIGYSLIPCFREENVTKTASGYRVKIEVLMGKAYYYAVRPLYYRGKRYFSIEKYYVCRDYISGEKPPYTSEGVLHFRYDDGSRVTDPGLCKSLEKKCRLLSML